MRHLGICGGKIRKKIPKKRHNNDKTTFLDEAGLKLCRKSPENMKNTRRMLRYAARFHRKLKNIFFKKS
jgi:hypothetical protein